MEWKKNGMNLTALTCRFKSYGPSDFDNAFEDFIEKHEIKKINRSN